MLAPKHQEGRRDDGLGCCVGDKMKAALLRMQRDEEFVRSPGCSAGGAESRVRRVEKASAADCRTVGDTVLKVKARALGLSS